MTDPRQLAYDFLSALAANDPAQYERVLHEDVGLRLRPLPEYRNQKLYSTLLRRRLEDARERGYQIVVIHAEPMSRRVVSRYGFEEFARFYIYAWMPVIDMEVIRQLVPDE